MSLSVYLGKRLVIGFQKREGLVISGILREACRFLQVLSVSFCDKSLSCTSCSVHFSVRDVFHNEKG